MTVEVTLLGLTLSHTHTHTHRHTYTHTHMHTHTHTHTQKHSCTLNLNKPPLFDTWKLVKVKQQTVVQCRPIHYTAGNSVINKGRFWAFSLFCNK